ncbi:MAG: hypothetical protein ABJF11_02250 [Reichenbachiella sp.]|uniref:hypothetical protein n=1 Tax=Reichenbachiella sp. TaxID=2184521 RepID=UPI0032673647
MTVLKSNHHNEVSFDAPIKSIIPGTDKDLLLIETADLATKVQTFFLVSLVKMEIIQAISLGEDYNGMVVKSYTNNRLLLIQYSSENNPDLTNIYLFSWNGGAPIFQLNDSRIVKLGPDWVQVPHPHFVGKHAYFDLQSGEVLKYEPTADYTDPKELCTFAVGYPESSEYFDWFKQYFRPHDIYPCRKVEYLKTKEKIFISYYHEKDSSLMHSLAILDLEGQLLECILLDEKLPGIGKDNFFVMGNKAIFVTHKGTLNIYDL